MENANTPDEPDAKALASMAEHVREKHPGRDFDPARDVAFPGNKAEDALLTWNPASGSYRCREHLGVVVYPSFELDSPGFVLAARLHDPALQPFLVGLYTPAERDEATRRYLRGEYGRELLTAARKLDRRRPPRKSQPLAAERMRRCQAFLLTEVAKHGNAARAVRTLDQLRTSDPERYAKLVLGRAVAPETLRKYWQATPDELVQEARREFQGRQAQEEGEELTR